MQGTTKVNPHTSSSGVQGRHCDDIGNHCHTQWANNVPKTLLGAIRVETIDQHGNNAEQKRWLQKGQIAGEMPICLGRSRTAVRAYVTFLSKPSVATTEGNQLLTAAATYV